MGEAKASAIKIPSVPAFTRWYTDKKRYKGAFGGRGGAKSMEAFTKALVLARNEKKKVFCTREIQRSINDSVHSLLEALIQKYELGDYEVLKTEIRNKITGSLFFFSGLREHTIDSIKSYHGIDLCIVEEAQSVTEKSLNILTPTVRNEGSEIWFLYNRMKETDPVHKLFKREIKTPGKQKVFVSETGEKYPWFEYESDTALWVKINYDGNPYFPDVLRREMERDKAEDYDLYLHKWEGEPISQSAFAIMSRNIIRSAMNRNIEKPEGQFVIGCDVARFGDDRTTIYRRRGLKELNHKVLTKADTVQVGRAILDMEVKGKTVFRVDDTGVGGGVTDYIRNQGRQVQAVNFGAKAKDADKYKNAISEMWFEVAEVLQDADIQPDEELFEELSSRDYTYDNKERKAIEPKEVYKKRFGKSPDKADGFIICFAGKEADPFKAWGL
jgi:phage terminase large subunit